MDMDTDLNLYSEERGGSEGCCSCEDSETSECSSCSCDCDSNYSSCRNSPKWIASNYKLDSNILKKLSFIEDLSKSHQGVDSNTFTQNNVPRWNTDKLNSTFKDSGFHFYTNKQPLFSEPSLSTLDTFNSNDLHNELKEIESLLTDTTPKLHTVSNTNYPLRSQSNPLFTLSSNTNTATTSNNNYYYNSNNNMNNYNFNKDNNNYNSNKNSNYNSLNSYSSVNSNLNHFNVNPDSFYSTLDINKQPSNNSLNTWPSGFNTPKYSYDDADYNDPEKLHSMMVSLDLFSYMYVVENVLDQKLKEELVES